MTDRQRGGRPYDDRVALLLLALHVSQLLIIHQVAPSGGLYKAWIAPKQQLHQGQQLVRLLHIALGLGQDHDITVVAFGLKDRKSTRLNSSHANISYAVFCLKKKEEEQTPVLLAQQ